MIDFLFSSLENFINIFFSHGANLTGLEYFLSSERYKFLKLILCEVFILSLPALLNNKTIPLQLDNLPLYDL